MPLSTFWYIKACVVCAYDLHSLFVILWEHSPCWTLGLNLTAQSMLLFIMDWCLFLSTSTESHQFNGAESVPVSLPLPWHWKQVWVFSLQNNPYFCISGFIWSFEDLIIRNICVCVYRYRCSWKYFSSLFLLVALLFSCLQLGSWGWQGWMNLVQCFGNSTGTDHSLQALWNHLRCLWLSWVSLQQQGLHLSCRTGPSSSFPGLEQRGRKQPHSPKNLATKLFAPVVQKDMKLPYWSLSFSYCWAWGKKCPSYLPVCSSFVRDRQCSLPLILLNESSCISRVVRKRSEASLSLQPGAASQSKTRLFSLSFSYHWAALRQ